MNALASFQRRSTPVGIRRDLRRLGRLLALGALSLTASSRPFAAEVITVPNGSFESPATNYVDTRIDFWQKTPKPAWYDENSMGLWDQLTGLFANLPPGDPRHIENCDGNQAIWVFAVPEAGLFQDYHSVDWSGATHSLDARFEAGKAYRLTVGVIGGFFGMRPGASLLAGLYYRDASSNRVTVAATNIVHSPSVFSNATQLVDFQVHTPTVKASDPWAGQYLGVQFLSTVDPALAGGYWDLDNVRLAVLSGPTLSGSLSSNGMFRLTLESEPGLRFEILATTSLATPPGDWSSLGMLTNVTGQVALDDPVTQPRRFYRARQSD